MAENKSEPTIDPLEASPEQTRAERAQQRLELSGTTALPAQAEGQKNNQFHSSYQNYLFGTSGDRNKPAWSDSTGGRAMIRLVSRGIVGAAAFTIGGRISRTQLMDYNPEAITLSFERESLKANWELLQKKPLQLVAKGFDIVFGKPISAMARQTAKWRNLDVAEQETVAWNAVNFRTKAYYHSKSGLTVQTQGSNFGKLMKGRSLGAEMVSTSFDFAMSSIGDASTRNFFQMIDPHIQKTWLVDDEGKTAKVGEQSHFSGSKFLRSFGKATWRVLSKNQGEDWAAALPYVYQMKAQRHLITRAMGERGKGAKIVFDNGWNGGAFKINHDGQIVGDYQLAGAMDLHARFVGYNVYTLMFREGYDAIGNTLKHWKEDHFKLHVPKEIHPIDEAVKAVRYVTKSAIKATIYMTPAVIPFWIMRVPQSKWRGAMINPNGSKGANAIALKTTAEHIQAVNVDGIQVLNHDTAGGRVFPGGHPQEKKMQLNGILLDNPFGGGKLQGPYDSHVTDHYTSKTEKAVADVLNIPGKISNSAGKWLFDKVHELPKDNWLRKFTSKNEAYMIGTQSNKHSDWASENFVRNFVDASFAYTPYMFAKAELGLRVDDHPSNGGPGNMDKAIYKLIDNVSAFNVRGVGRSVKDIWNLSTHIERQLVSREGDVAKTDVVDAAAPQVHKIPTTIVQPVGRVRHEPVELSKTIVNAKGELEDAPEKNERSWAESVAGRNLAAQFQPGTTQSRH